MEITFGYEKNLIICSSTSQLKMAIESSNNEKNIIIPDLEVLPYDNFSPHPEVSSNRLISFRDILKKSSVNVFTTIPALFQPLFDCDRTVVSTGQLKKLSRPEKSIPLVVSLKPQTCWMIPLPVAASTARPITKPIMAARPLSFSLKTFCGSGVEVEEEVMGKLNISKY